MNQLYIFSWFSGKHYPPVYPVMSVIMVHRRIHPHMSQLWFRDLPLSSPSSAAVVSSLSSRIRRKANTSVKVASITPMVRCRLCKGVVFKPILWPKIRCLAVRLISLAWSGTRGIADVSGSKDKVA